MSQQEDRPHVHFSAGGWLAPALVIGFTLFWILATYGLVGWRARDWQYGLAPYVPSESAFTSQPAPRGHAPNQVVLPEWTPGDANAKP